MSWTEITREQYRRDGLHYASDIDSQNGAACGFDAAKRLKRGQRHIVTVQVHAVNIQDNHRALPLLKSLGPAFPKLRYIFADRVYRGNKLLNAISEVGKWTIEIVTRSQTVGTFKAERKRWVVERTLAWFGRSHCLAKHGPLPAQKRGY